MKNKKLVKTLSTICCSGLIAISPICSVVGDETSTNVSSKKLQARQKFSNKYYHDANVTSDVITNDHINDYVNVASDKLQCMLNASGLEDDDIISDIVATFKANCLRKDSLNDINDENARNAFLLQQSKREAAKLGIDVVDFDLMNNAVKDQFTSLYKEQLSNSGYLSDSQINQIMDKFNNAFVKLSNTAQDKMYGEYDFYMQLADATANILDFDPVTGERYTDEQIYQQISQRKLAYILEKVKELVHNGSLSLTTDPDGSNNYIVSRLADYSENNSGWSVGSSLQYYVDKLGNRVDNVSDADHISYADLSNVLMYKYDPHFGTPYKDYKMWIIPDIQPKTEGDKDSDGSFKYNYGEWTKTISTEMPFSYLSNSTVTYGDGEIFPGFALHLRINSIENEENSHQCNISFQVGISNSQQDKINIDNNVEPDVLWDESQSEDGKVVPNVTFNEQLNVTDLSLIKNISKNKYYDFSSSEYTAVLPDSIQPDDFGCYFSDTADQRVKLDIISQKIQNEDGTIQDLSKNPLLLSESTSNNTSYIDGIAMPDNIKNMWGNQYHTNQSIAMFADGIDTNTNSLNVFYAIVDHLSSNCEIVHRIPWVIGGVEHSSIPVGYGLSAGLKQQITIASTVKTVLPVFTSNTHLFTDKINYIYEDWDFIHQKPVQERAENQNVADLYIQYFSVHKNLVIGEEILEDTLVLLCGAFVVLAFISEGAGSLGIAVAFFCLSLVQKILGIPASVSNYKYELPDEREWKSQLEACREAYKCLQDNVNLDTILSLQNELNDKDPNNDLIKENVSYSRKKEISSNIFSTFGKYNIYDKNSDFMKFTNSIISAQMKYEGKTEKEIEEEISKYTNAWASCKDDQFFLGDGFLSIIDLTKFATSFVCFKITQLNLSVKYFKIGSDTERLKQLNDALKGYQDLKATNEQIIQDSWNRQMMYAGRYAEMERIYEDQTADMNKAKQDLDEAEKAYEDSKKVTQAAKEGWKRIDSEIQATNKKYQDLFDAAYKRIDEFKKASEVERQKLVDKNAADIESFDNMVSETIKQYEAQITSLSEDFFEWTNNANEFNKFVYSIEGLDGSMIFHDSEMFDTYFYRFVRKWTSDQTTIFEIQEEFFPTGRPSNTNDIFHKLFPNMDDGIVVTKDNFKSVLNDEYIKSQNQVFKNFSNMASKSSSAELINMQDEFIDELLDTIPYDTDKFDTPDLLKEAKSRFKQIKNYNEAEAKVWKSKIESKQNALENYKTSMNKMRSAKIQEQNNNLKEFDEKVAQGEQDIRNEISDLREQQENELDALNAEYEKQTKFVEACEEEEAIRFDAYYEEQQQYGFVCDKVDGHLKVEIVETGRNIALADQQRLNAIAEVDRAEESIRTTIPERDQVEADLAEEEAEMEGLEKWSGGLMCLTLLLTAGQILCSWADLLFEDGLPNFSWTM